jgi:hypothetical protein
VISRKAIEWMAAEYRARRYQDALLSDHWRELKKEIRERCQGICEYPPGCDAPCRELHHKTYCRLGAELPRDVLYLCREHHELLHSTKTLRRK